MLVQQLLEVLLGLAAAAVLTVMPLQAMRVVQGWEVAEEQMQQAAAVAVVAAAAAGRMCGLLCVWGWMALGWTPSL
jgi:hypothetical protein